MLSHDYIHLLQVKYLPYSQTSKPSVHLLETSMQAIAMLHSGSTITLKCKVEHLS